MPPRTTSATATAGHSSTPLAQKLGIVAGSHVLRLGAPGGCAGLLAPLAAHLVEPMQALKLVVRTTLR